MLVGKIMTAEVISITPETSHREAFELMKKHGISQLPVLEKGHLVGIVSERDLLSTQPSPATSLSIHEIYALLEKLKVKQFMSHPVYTVAEDCPVEVAANIMLEHGLGSVPIMRGDELVGIVSETDIFKVLVEVLGGGHEGLRFTLGVENAPGVLADVAQAIAGAGGNIVSVVTWSPGGGPESELTIKEKGADTGTLRQALEAIDAEVRDVRDGGAIEPGIFGKPKS